MPCNIDGMMYKCTEEMPLALVRLRTAQVFDRKDECVDTDESACASLSRADVPSQGCNTMWTLRRQFQFKRIVMARQTLKDELLSAGTSCHRGK